MAVQHADLVVTNANVITMDPAQPRAEAVAVGDGRILAVGSNAEAASWSGSAATLDLRGRTLLPGFFDSHNHTLFTGHNLAHVDLSQAKTVADVLDAIEQRARVTPPGQWVLASSRWHETQLAEKRFPRSSELDRVAPNHPVLIPRGGHNVVVNSAAFQMAGIGQDTPNPAGGTFVRDGETGELTGHALDAAMRPLKALVPPPTPADSDRALRAVQRLYNQAGITSVIDPGLQPGDMAVYRNLRDAGELTLRANMMWRLMPGFDDHSLQAALDLIASGAVAIDGADPWLRTVALKVSVDGGVEAGYYREPYAHPDDPAHPRGLPLLSQENFDAFCLKAVELGWQMGTHCVGDAGIDMVLKAYAKADQARSLKGRRWTLVHMMHAQEDHWAEANRMGLIVTAQQPLLFTLADGFRHYIGPERTRDIEPLRMYLQRSTQPVGGGSDSPVTPYQPLTGIWSSVTRVTNLAGVQGPEWGVTTREALEMYTRGSAWASVEDDVKGSLTAGKYADFVVLDGDPLAVEPAALKELGVVRTIVGGRTVYDGDEGLNADRPSAGKAAALEGGGCDCAEE